MGSTPALGLVAESARYADARLQAASHHLGVAACRRRRSPTRRRWRVWAFEAIVESRVAKAAASAEYMPMDACSGTAVGLAVDDSRATSGALDWSALGSCGARPDLAGCPKPDLSRRRDARPEPKT